MTDTINGQPITPDRKHGNIQDIIANVGQKRKAPIIIKLKGDMSRFLRKARN
jgi:hypothetical protein